MNEITQTVVAQAARDHKAEAKRNGEKFTHLVQVYHWDEIINRAGWQLKSRALQIWEWFHPELFVDGILDDGAGPWAFDVDVALSRLVVRVLERKIKRDPELKLEDWGDLPQRVADPQLRMF